MRYLENNDMAMFEGSHDMLRKLLIEGDNYAMNVEENSV